MRHVLCKCNSVWKPLIELLMVGSCVCTAWLLYEFGSKFIMTWLTCNLRAIHPIYRNALWDMAALATAKQLLYVPFRNCKQLLADMNIRMHKLFCFLFTVTWFTLKALSLWWCLHADNFIDINFDAQKLMFLQIRVCLLLSEEFIVVFLNLFVHWRLNRGCKCCNNSI